MLAALSDHHSFGTARRSLLISAFLVIVISAAKIEGNTIQILGLGLAFSKPNLVFLLQIISAYLLWVFIWVSLTEFYPKFKVALIENHQRIIEFSLQEARRIDDQVYSRDEEDHGFHEPDGWWEAHHELEVKKKANIARLEKLERLFEIGRLVVVEILPVAALAVSALFWPDAIASLLTSE